VAIAVRFPSFIAMLVLFLIRLIRGLVREGEHIDEGSHGLWYGLCILGMVFTVAAFGNGLFAVPAIIMYLVVFPWAVTRYALIPLGWHRSAYHLTRLAEWVWGKDARGGAAVAASWALLRSGDTSATSIAWVDSRIASSKRIGGAQVLATGLLCAVRGDAAAARTLLESIETLGHKVTPSMARRLANEWLVADAAERGEWSRVHELTNGTAPQSRMTRLLGGVASRLCNSADAPGDNQLSLLWMAAPARRATRALVRNAFATRRNGADQSSTTAPESDVSAPFRDCHADALTAHVVALSADPVTRTADDLCTLGRAWDRALFAPATRTHILERGAALGTRDASAMLDELGDVVARDIAAMARAARLPVADFAGDSRVLHEAARVLRDGLMGEIDFAFDALGQRVDEQRGLSPIEEWREWLALRELHERTSTLGGLDLRRLAFPHVHSNICSLAVWLWNDRGERVIANAMFRWLLDEAMAVGDAEAIELQGNNASLEP
jgi:hypothetical protein